MKVRRKCRASVSLHYEHGHTISRLHLERNSHNSQIQSAIETRLHSLSVFETVVANRLKSLVIIRLVFRAISFGPVRGVRFMLRTAICVHSAMCDWSAIRHRVGCQKYRRHRKYQTLFPESDPSHFPPNAPHRGCSAFIQLSGFCVALSHPRVGLCESCSEEGFIPRVPMRALY